jgi:hypothetical protein
MKRSITIALCLLASLAAVSASAQDHTARATIPFAFYVGDKWLPAGNYQLTSDAGNNVITVRNLDQGVSAVRMSGPAEQPSISNKLVFLRYGDKAFLHDVLCASPGMRVEFPASRREKEARLQEASAGQATTVYLALR